MPNRDCGKWFVVICNQRQHDGFPITTAPPPGAEHFLTCRQTNQINKQNNIGDTMPVNTTPTVAKKFLAEKRVLVTRARKEAFEDGVNLHKDVEAAKAYLADLIKEGDEVCPHIIWVPTLVIHPNAVTRPVTTNEVEVTFRDRSVGSSAGDLA